MSKAANSDSDTYKILQGFSKVRIRERKQTSAQKECVSFLNPCFSLRYSRTERWKNLHRPSESIMSKFSQIASNDSGIISSLRSRLSISMLMRAAHVISSVVRGSGAAKTHLSARFAIWASRKGFFSICDMIRSYRSPSPRGRFLSSYSIALGDLHRCICLSWRSTQRNLARLEYA